MALKQSHSLAIGRAARSLAQRIPLSDAVLKLCYWCTVVMVVAAGAYEFHWPWTHSLVPVPAVDDPLGITSPPWIADVFFRLLIFGYLAEACRQAVCGNRRWDSIGIAVLAIMAVGWMQRLAEFMTAK